MGGAPPGGARPGIIGAPDVGGIEGYEGPGGLDTGGICWGACGLGGPPGGIIGGPGLGG